MSVDAGSVKGQIILDDSQFQQAANRSKKGTADVGISFGKMASSVFLGQTAYNLAAKALTGLVNIGKKSIENYRQQEQAEAKLVSQIGKNISEYKAFASQMQRATVIGDESVLSAMALAKSMGNTNGKLKEVTKGAIGLSEAFGIDLNTSVKLVTLANQGEYTMLGRYIPALRTATTEAEKHAIVQKAMANGFNQAKAKAGTFTGSLEQLKNANSDISEEFGKVISVIGRDFVDSLLKGSYAISDFITSAQGIETISDIWGGIGGSVEVAKTIFDDFSSTMKDKVLGIVNSTSKKLGELFEGVDTGNTLLFVLAGIVKGVGLAFGIATDVLSVYIDWNLNLIKIIKEGVITIGAFFKALSNPFDASGWEKLGEQANKTWEAIKDTGKELVTDVKSTVLNAWEEIKNLPKDTEQLAKDLGKAWDKGFAESKAKMKTGLTSKDVLAANKIEIDANDEKNKDKLKSDRDYLKEWQSIQDKQNDNTLAGINDLAKKYKQAGADEIAVDKWKMNEKAKTVKSKIAEVIGYIIQFAQASASLADTIFSGWLETENNKAELMANRYEEDLEDLEEQKEAKLEQIEEEFEEQADALKELREEGAISATEYHEQMDELERQKAQKTIDTQKMLDEKIEMQKKKQLEKQNAQGKKVFEAEKNNKISATWLQWGIGTMAVWASAFQSMGNPIVAAVVAAAMSAILLAQAIASNAVISQQQYVPMRAKGGTIRAGQPILAGEQGAEVIIPKTDGTVLPSDITERVLRNTNFGTSSSTQMVNNFSFKGANIDSKMGLKEITNYMVTELSRRFKLA